MHRTSFLKVQSFWDQYMRPLADQRTIRVLDVGSKSYDGHDSYRGLMDRSTVDYVGLDLEPGCGVDIVPKHPFVWSELPADQFDFCISGQTFEHNPLFWVTFAEIARVLKPGGYAFVIAPGRGVVHRYPLDCWRFFPDAWHALCQYCGMQLVESYFEDTGNRRAEPSLMWCDSCVVARKPLFADEHERKNFDQQLAAIAATATHQVSIPASSQQLGPCLNDYVSANRYRHGLVPRIHNVMNRFVSKLRRHRTSMGSVKRLFQAVIHS